MILFDYLAKNKEGEVIRGEIEAENEMAAARILSGKDLVPIEITDKKETPFGFLNHISLKDKALFTRQLATMINAGLPITESLKTIEAQVNKKGLKRILAQVIGDVEGGSQLSLALSRFPDTFTPLDLTLIASGETSGTLDKALLRMADQLEKQQSIMRKVRGALVYPSFVLLVVIIVAAIMVIYVMPQMDELYKSFGAKLPFLTRVLIGLSKFTAKSFPYVLAIFISIVAYIRFAIQKPLGRKLWDSLKLKIYGLNNLLKKIYMSRFSRTLSGLISSGVPLLDALKIVSDSVGNVIYREIITKAAKKVKGGVSLSDAIKEHPEIPAVVGQMISVGEKTGEIDKMLQNLADYYEEEVDATVKSISNLVEPIIIVILAILIAIMLLGIMMPIYQIGRIL